MADAGSMKPCHACLRDIAPAARRCPHCRAWQDRLGRLSSRRWLHAGVSLYWGVMMAMPMVFMFVMLARVAQWAGEVATPPGAVRVEVLHKHTGMFQGRPLLVLTGEIENTTDQRYGWVGLEVRLLDKEGRTLDCTTVMSFQTPPAEAGSKAFQVVWTPDRPPEEWGEVIVRARPSAFRM